MVERDQHIIRFLADFRFATASQLATIFFAGSVRSAQARLKKLYERKHVKRFGRPAKGFNEYVYCVSQRNKQQLEHYLAVTQAYVDLHTLPGKVDFIPHYLVAFTHRGKRWRFVADALVTYYRPDGSGRMMFLEVERRDYSRRYNKRAHYEAYYASNAWKQQTWSRGGKVFPAIVIMAEKDRLKSIKTSTMRTQPAAPWVWVVEGELVGWVG